VVGLRATAINLQAEALQRNGTTGPLRSPQLGGTAAGRVIDLLEEVKPNREQVLVFSSPAWRFRPGAVWPIPHGGQKWATNI
jgi:hypothetical protein